MMPGRGGSDKPAMFKGVKPLVYLCCSTGISDCHCFNKVSEDTNFVVTEESSLIMSSSLSPVSLFNFRSRTGTGQGKTDRHRHGLVNYFFFSQCGEFCLVHGAWSDIYITEECAQKYWCQVFVVGRGTGKSYSMCLMKDEWLNFCRCFSLCLDLTCLSDAFRIYLKWLWGESVWSGLERLPSAGGLTQTTVMSLF